MVATKNNFIEMIQSEPSVLHISCHGIRVGSTMSADDRKLNNLLFETPLGEGELVNQKTLEKLIK